MIPIYVDMSIKDKLTDYKTDDLTNIINDPIQSTSPVYEKINIYNNNIDSPLQKIWIRTPSLKIFRSVKSPNGRFNRSIPLQLVLNENDKATRKLRIFMRKLEIKVNKLIRELTNNNKIKSKTSLKKIPGFPQIMTVNMPFNKVNDCYEFNFHIYNNLNKRINFDYLESGSFVSAFLELSEVWISSVSFGYNWTVKQLKIYPKLDFSKCLFDDIDTDNKVEEVTVQEECYHCMYCPNNHIRTHCCSNNLSNHPFTYDQRPKNDYGQQIQPPNLPPPPPIYLNNNTNNNNQTIKKFAPTITDLLNVKLKPIKCNIDSPENPYIGNVIINSDDLISTKNKLKKINVNHDTHNIMYKRRNDYMVNTIKDIKKQIKPRNKDIDDKYKKLMDEFTKLKN